MGQIKKCQLHVKEIQINNFNDIKNLNIGWRFDKKTGTLYIKAVEETNLSMGFRSQQINTAYRDYDDFLF